MATEDKKMNAGSVNPADTRGVLKDFYEQDAANGELAEDKKQELLKNLKEFFVRLFQKYNILER